MHIRLWNSLPDSIRSISDITLFRSKLKTYLMENAYSTGWNAPQGVVLKSDDRGNYLTLLYYVC